MDGDMETLRSWVTARLTENRDGRPFPLGAYREGKDKAWRDTLSMIDELDQNGTRTCSR